MNLRLTLCYDGGAFLGWQKTACGRGVEDALSSVLEKILGASVKLQAASRTDKGVHARGQIVNFHAELNMPLADLKYKLNRMLPDSLVVTDIEQASEDFHPSCDSRGKHYIYTLQTSPVSPLERHTIWHFIYPIDSAKMQCAARQLIGQHDFGAFENFSYSPAKDTCCEIFSLEIAEIAPFRYQIDISGNRFLYKMVRNIVGTLCYVGAGKLPEEVVSDLLSGGRRADAGMCAPAHGLILQNVLY